MRARAVKGMRVVDSEGIEIGEADDVDMKRTGNYALIVKGEAHASSAKMFKEKLGVSGVGKDFFEIPQEHISDISNKVHLNKRFEDIQNVIILSGHE
jgi:sporulation protein YlmC with PRC-barrel domain